MYVSQPTRIRDEILSLTPEQSLAERQSGICRNRKVVVVKWSTCSQCAVYFLIIIQVLFILPLDIIKYREPAI